MEEEVVEVVRRQLSKTEEVEISSNIKEMMKEYESTMERGAEDDDEYTDVMEDAYLLEFKAVRQAKRLSPEAYKRFGLEALFGIPHDELECPEF